VTRSLAELVDLLGQVCPRDHRIILTVSPVPLQATFTSSDVAVANAYSKSVLRAAVEPFVADHPHIEYFPSYESVVLTDRSIAFVDDQVHIQASMVRFNVDRMINRYVAAGDDSVASVIASAREDAAAGRFQAGLKRLQRAWAADPASPDLTIALARAHLRAGGGDAAETLLLELLQTHDSVPARTILSRHYNETGRHEEAALARREGVRARQGAARTFPAAGRSLLSPGSVRRRFRRARQDPLAARAQVAAAALEGAILRDNWGGPRMPKRSGGSATASSKIRPTWPRSPSSWRPRIAGRKPPNGSTGPCSATRTRQTALRLRAEIRMARLPLRRAGDAAPATAQCRPGRHALDDRADQARGRERPDRRSGGGHRQSGLVACGLERVEHQAGHRHGARRRPAPA
jgi:hypothetical protein